MAALPTVRLLAGRDKKIRSRYPWAHRDDIAEAGKASTGGLARLAADNGDFLGIGTYSSESRFPLRLLTQQDEPIDLEFFRRRIREAAARRAEITDTDAQRVVYAEADGLPGLLVDRFDDTLVVQVRTAGMEKLRPIWTEALQMEFEPGSIYERSDMEGRRDEGLEPKSGLIQGRLPHPVVLHESGMAFEALVETGLKTGFYLDQRDTRRRLAARVKQGEKVLDAFCYVGAFSIYAAKAGAETLGLDIHEPSLAAAKRIAKRNAVEAHFHMANVFEWLQAGGDGRRYDWIILDPPAIAKTKETHDSLKWAIWKLVYHGIDSLALGGRMIVCSCAYQMGLRELMEIIRLAAAEHGRAAYFEEVTVQGQDHPILASFPESWYLKCVWVRMEN